MCKDPEPGRGKRISNNAGDGVKGFGITMAALRESPLPRKSDGEDRLPPTVGHRKQRGRSQDGDNPCALGTSGAYREDSLGAHIEVEEGHKKTPVRGHGLDMPV